MVVGLKLVGVTPGTTFKSKVSMWLGGARQQNEDDVFRRVPWRHRRHRSLIRRAQLAAQPGCRNARARDFEELPARDVRAVEEGLVRMRIAP